MEGPFSIDIIARALTASGRVAAVEVVEALQAGVNQVARLRVRFADGRPELRAIGKAARGPGIAAARRELAFFERIAPGWDSRAPGLLGAHDAGDTLVIVTEDLDAAGYALIGAAVREAHVRGAIDALATLHARFWDAVPSEYLDSDDSTSVTRCARAWPPSAIARHAAAAHHAADRFTAAGELTRDERGLLDEIFAAAPAQFTARVAPGRALTLIHADYHFFGNVFFAAHDPRPRIIDWSELKPGLGPHDVAYCLTGVPADDRAARDLAALRHYWQQLHGLGVTDYTWLLCQWDYHFSLINNVFQALFQDSSHWLRHSLATVALHAAHVVLREPPPLAALAPAR